MQNKPNSWRTRFPVFHYSLIPAFQSGAYRAKQSQFHRSDGKGQVLCGKRVMVNRTGQGRRQNKANFAPYGKGREPVAAGVQTKPIWEGVSILRFQVLSTRPSKPGGEPSGSSCFKLHTLHFKTRPKAVRAKQSQFRPEHCGGQFGASSPGRLRYNAGFVSRAGRGE